MDALEWIQNGCEPQRARLVIFLKPDQKRALQHAAKLRSMTTGDFVVKMILGDTPRAEETTAAIQNKLDELAKLQAKLSEVLADTKLQYAELFDTGMRGLLSGALTTQEIEKLAVQTPYISAEDLAE